MAETEKKSAAIKRAKKLMLPKDLPAKYDHAQWRAKHGKDAGTAELQPYHRAKLRALLASSLQEHLYSAASGPVSVLIQAHAREDVYQHRDLHYFWGAHLTTLRSVNSFVKFGPNYYKLPLPSMQTEEIAKPHTDVADSQFPQQ